MFPKIFNGHNLSVSNICFTQLKRAQNDVNKRRYGQYLKCLILPSLWRGDSFWTFDKNMSNDVDTEDDVEDDLDDQNNETPTNNAPEDTVSRVYIKNTFEDRLYLLIFNAIDVQLQPVYLQDRAFETSPNDKSIQPRTTMKYVNRRVAHCQKLNVTHKVFSIDHANDRVPIMEHKKAFLAPMKREPAEQRKKIPISSQTSSIGKSVININHKDLSFRLYPGIVDLRFVKLKDVDNRGSHQDKTKYFQLESTEKMINKAQILVKQRKDILRFVFNMANISYEPEIEHISRGIQVSDNNIYTVAISEVTKRQVHFPVPKGTYYFIDPNIRVGRRNTNLRFNKLEPRWKRHVRNQRLKEYKRCRVTDPYEHLPALKFGSTLYYEDKGHIYKAKTDLVNCKVAHDQYEQWAIGTQRQSSLNLKSARIHGDTDRNDEVGHLDS